MVHPINAKAKEREKAIHKAIADIQDRTYMSIEQAVKDLRISMGGVSGYCAFITVCIVV